MFQRQQIAIPCQHEAHNVSESIAVPDYHPLTWPQLESLVSLAFNKITDAGIVSDVQIRLSQAIPGYECPCLTTGPVAETERLLARTFCDGIEVADTKAYKLTRKFFDLVGISPAFIKAPERKLARKIGQILKIHPE